MFKPSTASLRRNKRKPGTFILLETFLFVTVSGFSVLVPQGFVTDLASIPRVLRLFIQVNGRHSDAAIIHDWLYYKRGHIGPWTLTRKQCDDIFLEAMLESGVPKWKAWTMWSGVRVGGWAAWGSK